MFVLARRYTRPFILITGVVLLAGLLAWFSLPAKAAESDAIAVRIMPNLNHDSIDVWYAKQGYRGAPQSLTVDGYEAIRDGRTVFVNAANLDVNGKKIYTNIYLISYNQESEAKTQDILGQLVSHWKFNTNISQKGNCTIATTACSKPDDCPKDFICANDSNNPSYGKCVPKEPKTCSLDSDCPVNTFCNSLKSSLIRDVNRLGKLRHLERELEKYKEANGRYPELSSGSYLPGVSMSVWPSWTDNLQNQLGVGNLALDPINSLGYCPGFESKTCWSPQSKQFFNSDLTLPAGSYAIIYDATQGGSAFGLCSTFETQRLGYDTSSGTISRRNCSVRGSNYQGGVINLPPYVISAFLNGESRKEFNGFIKVRDNEGDSISWNLAPAGSFASWGQTPVLRDTGDPTQKRLYANQAGNEGVYPMVLTLTDSRGAATSTRLALNISGTSRVVVEADDADYYVSQENIAPYYFFINTTDSNPSFSLAVQNDSLSAFKAALATASAQATRTAVTGNRIRIDLNIKLTPDVATTSNLEVPILIKATDNSGSSEKIVSFRFRVDKPLLSFSCPPVARLGKPYPIGGSRCLLGPVMEGQKTLNYQILPSNVQGLTTAISGSDTFLFSNAITGPTTNPHQVTVKVTDSLGASEQKNFNLKINTFCGDGIKQVPNTEGAGGLYNDGVEQCDGLDGVWKRTDVMSTSPNEQYACNTGLNVETPYPIRDNNHCTFKDGSQGGGYCGDGLCQNNINGVEMETCKNCEADCGACKCTPKCSVNVCGDDGCGGTCGTCNNSEICVSGLCCPTEAKVQICADNEHITYFNGRQVGSGNNWKNVEEFNVTLDKGVNYFSIKATDYGVQWGVSATLNFYGCRSQQGTTPPFSMNTTKNFSDWKCTRYYYEGWNEKGYNYSWWPRASNLGNTGPNVPGNALPYAQIWAANENRSADSRKEIYCIYSFNSY